MTPFVKFITCALAVALAFLMFAIPSCCVCEDNREFPYDQSEFGYVKTEKFWIHGQVDEHGFEHTRKMYVYYYNIQGHEFAAVDKDYADYIHLPNCKACKAERDSLVRAIVRELDKSDFIIEYVNHKIDSISDKNTKDVKNLIRRNTKQIMDELKGGLIEYD